MGRPNKFSYILTISLVGLLAICALVYHKGYSALSERIVFNGSLIADRISDRIHSEFGYMEEQVQTYAESLGQESVDFHSAIQGIVSDNELKDMFITAFEMHHGYRLYEQVSLTDEHGKRIASSCESFFEIADEHWWDKAVANGTSYSLTQGNPDERRIMFAVAIRNKTGRLLGVIQAICSIPALVRGKGFNLEQYQASMIEIATGDGALLYSTVLHRPYSDYSEAEPYKRMSRGEMNYVWTDERGFKELVVIRTYTHNFEASLSWVMVVHFDYGELFKPVISMRWWIGAGVFALLLTACSFFFLIRTITLRDARGSTLQENQALLHKIFEGLAASIFFIDQEKLEITWANKVSQGLLGKPMEEIIGSKCYGSICPLGQNAVHERDCPARGKTLFHREFLLKREDGVVLPVSKTVMNVEINDRPHFVSVLFDISERKKIERQLAHSQKLESIGSLAAGVAHEINTPTQYIADNLSFLSESTNSLWKILALYGKLHEPEEEHSFKALLDEIAACHAELDIDFLAEEIPRAISQSREGVSRISSIVQAMKRFSHPGSESMQLGDINDALTTTSLVCRNEWKYHADLSYDFDQNLPYVRCFVSDMNQVFLNLIINATHAVKEKFSGSGRKGQISLTTRTSANEVLIIIKDNGKGVKKADLGRVFDPFFTTKEVGQGTGQGLALCYAIVVNKHQGFISMDSEEGEWTQCTIRLPLQTEHEG